MENEFFSRNGRIKIPPCNSKIYKNGNDYFEISFYKINNKFNFAIKSQLQKRIFVRYPHPEDDLLESVEECKQAGLILVKKFCYENKLKKCFDRIVPNIFWQLELFDDL